MLLSYILYQKFDNLLSLSHTILSGPEPKLPNQTQNQPQFHQLRRPGLSLDFLTHIEPRKINKSTHHLPHTTHI